MTLREIVGNIGKTAKLRTGDGIEVDVKILDAKMAYGNIRYTIAPVSGAGEAVVDAARLKVAA